MKPKKPRFGFAHYGSCLVVFGALGFVFDFLPSFVVIQTLTWGTVILVSALLFYRVEWKQYRAHQATPPTEEDPTP